jgi:uncharacterized membrane protein
MFITEKSERRLASLDVLRGLAILGMLPFHLFFFGGFFRVSKWLRKSNIEQSISIEFRSPLGTGLFLFNFVTGVNPAVSSRS